MSHIHASYSANTTSWIKGSRLLLDYKVRESSLSHHAPLILMLHGVGSNEKDLFRLADKFPEEYLVISARAPFSFGSTSYGWYEVDFSSGKPVYNQEQVEKSRQLIVQFINQLQEKYNSDSKKVYLLGFSQGAIMSYSVAASFPKKIKGIAAMSGRVLREDQEKIVLKEELDIDVFIAHSSSDQILPYSEAILAKQLLGDRVYHFKFKTHHRGHSLPEEILSEWIEWISE